MPAQACDACSGMQCLQRRAMPAQACDVCTICMLLRGRQLERHDHGGWWREPHETVGWEPPGAEVAG
eukprot:5027576-Prymnesium_polylepis.1